MHFTNLFQDNYGYDQSNDNFGSSDRYITSANGQNGQPQQQSAVNPVHSDPWQPPPPAPAPQPYTNPPPPPPPQVIFIQAPKMVRSFEKYPVRLVAGLGWLQLFTGVMSIILGIANPLTCGLYGMVGIGIWGGVLYFLAGIFGILSARRKTSQTIVTHMVLCIVGSLCAVVQLAINATAAYYDHLVYGCWYYDVSNEATIDYRGTVWVDALLALFGIIQGVAAIVASSTGCKVVCCSAAFVPVSGTGGITQSPYGGAMPPATMVYYSPSSLQGPGEQAGNGGSIAGYPGPLFANQIGKAPANYPYSPPNYTPTHHSNC